jgi:hypothetical protein
MEVDLELLWRICTAHTFICNNPKESVQTTARLPVPISRDVAIFCCTWLLLLLLLLLLQHQHKLLRLENINHSTDETIGICLTR